MKAPRPENMVGMEEFYSRFPDVHPSIVLKTDIIRTGIDISEKAKEDFESRDDLLWKGFHMFSYEYQQTAIYSDKTPYFFRLEDGSPLQFRGNSASPYVLDLLDDGEFVIRRNGEIVARKTTFEPKPKWYDLRTEKEGVLMGAIAQGHCRSLFITISKYCEFWKTQDQCLFCDIVNTMKAQTKGGEDFVARIDPDTIGEVVQTAIHLDPLYAIAMYVSGERFSENTEDKQNWNSISAALRRSREGLGPGSLPVSRSRLMMMKDGGDCVMLDLPELSQTSRSGTRNSSNGSALARPSSLDTTYDQIPKEIIEPGKVLTLTVFGATIAGVKSEGCGVLGNFAIEWGGKGECTILMHGVKSASVN